MTSTTWACEILEGVNWSGEFPSCCSWSGCPRPPSFVVSHPVLEWVPTCLECVDGGRCGDVRKVRHDEYMPGIEYKPTTTTEAI
jgi:hypothetical protein